jgi:formylglycine-generating enzyme required for sulfatase activity
MSKVLISYRREDSAHVTGRIYDRLVQQFGRTAVFKDVDSIPLGIDFRTYLDQQVAKCDVFLAVIGRNWMKPQGQKGKSRLADPADFVRLEIEAALKRQIPVIPVLVEGASIPAVDRLPTSLQGLSYRNGIVVRPDPDFHRDMDRLIEHLRAQIESQLAPGPLPDMPPTASDAIARPEAARSEVEGPRPDTVEVAAPLSRLDSPPKAMQLKEDAPVESPDAHRSVRDGNEAEEDNRLGVEQTGPEHVEAAAPSFEADSRQRAEDPIEEATSTGTYQKPMDHSSSYLFGVIGLVVLIGAVAAFLILQPTSRSVESNRYVPPPVVEKKEEPPVQVPTTITAPPRPSETTVVPKKQEKPVEKRVETSRSSIPTPAMVRISPGSFMMGGSGKYEGTHIHEVHFARSFAMARYETTFDEYDRFAQATGRPLPNDEGWGRGSRPVINVSWDDAKAYAQWLSQQTGKRYRLPTEAEWEYAARSGGQDQTWAGTSDETQLKNYAVYRARRTESVGSKQPNSLGLYDMSGNVWEWVEDCWHKDYEGAPTEGSAWLGTNDGNCARRVIRGGSRSDGPGSLRASDRSNPPSIQAKNIGFRLVQDLP